MKRLLNIFILFCVSFLYTHSTLAVDYNYTTLLFLDYNELKPIVANSIKESRSFKYPDDGERATGPLKKTLRMLLSRPDSDDLMARLSVDLIRDLKSMGIFEETVDEFFEDGKNDVYDTSLSKKVRTTNLIMLNNLLLLIRPMTLSSVTLAKSVCRMADSKMSIPRDIQQQAALTTMLKEPSPTKLAQKIMRWYAQKKGKETRFSQKGCPFSKHS